MEGAHPVEGAALGCGGAIGVHPVHAALCNQRHERLGKLLHRLVEGFGGGVAVLAEHLILRCKESLDGSHQRAALAGQIGDSLTLDGRLKQISRANADADGQRLIERPPADILVDGIRGVDTPSLNEEGTQRRARSLRCNQDDVDILRRHNTRAVAPRDRKAMREVERLAGRQMRLNLRPALDLSRVRKKHTDHRAALRRLLERKQRLARHPAVGNSFFVRLSGALAHDDMETIIAQVARLTGALYAIT